MFAARLAAVLFFWTLPCFAGAAKTFVFPIESTTQSFAVPFRTCYDSADFTVERMTGDGSQFYGIRAEALDSRGDLLAMSWIHESYVPPAPENVHLTLPPGVASIRTTIFGDQTGTPEGLTWQNASLTMRMEAPPLSIAVEHGWAYLSWPGQDQGCWTPQRRNSDGPWENVPAVLKANESMAFFRLSRE